jgi:hypothetical protein
MRLTEIAKDMKIESYNTGKSYRRLWGGLELTLTPYKQGWQLTLRRENTEPSKNEYRIISKAFFNGRVKHLSQPNENSLEIKTQ